MGRMQQISTIKIFISHFQKMQIRIAEVYDILKLQQYNLQKQTLKLTV